MIVTRLTEQKSLLKGPRTCWGLPWLYPLTSIAKLSYLDHREGLRRRKGERPGPQEKSLEILLSGKRRRKRAPRTTEQIQPK